MPFWKQLLKKMSPKRRRDDGAEAVVAAAPTARARATSRSRSCARRPASCARDTRGGSARSRGWASRRVLQRQSKKSELARSRSRSMRLRNCLGMIWSVSTFTRSSGTTRPLCRRERLVHGLYLLDLPARGCRRNGPAIAAAAAIAGLTRCVRPPLPCRPSKLRFEVEAQRSPGCEDVGFMPRHIEQPGSRQSKPPSRKTCRAPRASASP